MTEPEKKEAQKPVRDDKWAEEKFPNRGERPSDKYIIDTNAEPAPNIGHPE